MPGKPGTTRRHQGSKLRSWRQKMDLEGAVITGPRKIQEVVYCYRFPSRPDRVKIGYSSRGLRRVAEQSTAFPETPEVLFVIHDPRARAIEEAFHIALSDRQSNVMGTEWFDVGWSDLLRVSPTLRRATGLGRLRWRLRLMASGCLLVVGGLAYPALAAVPAGILEGAGLSVMLEASQAYLESLLSPAPALAIERGGDLLRYAWTRPGWPVPAILTALLAMAPASLPWWRPRQAV